MLDDLGLNGLKSLVFYSGFDGDAKRGLAEIDMPGAAQGLAVGVRRQTVHPWATLPPMPPDVVSWSMMNFDAATFYDASYTAIEAVVGLIEPTAAAGGEGVPEEAERGSGRDGAQGPARLAGRPGRDVQLAGGRPV